VKQPTYTAVLEPTAWESGIPAVLVRLERPKGTLAIKKGKKKTMGKGQLMHYIPFSIAL
jgi:hypothetical protein